MLNGRKLFLGNTRRGPPASRERNIHIKCLFDHNLQPIVRCTDCVVNEGKRKTMGSVYEKTYTVIANADFPDPRCAKAQSQARPGALQQLRSRVARRTAMKPRHGRHAPATTIPSIGKETVTGIRDRAQSARFSLAHAHSQETPVRQPGKVGKPLAGRCGICNKHARNIRTGMRERLTDLVADLKDGRANTWPYPGPPAAGIRQSLLHCREGGFQHAPGKPAPPCMRDPEDLAVDIAKHHRQAIRSQDGQHAARRGRDSRVGLWRVRGVSRANWVIRRRYGISVGHCGAMDLA